MAGKPLQQSYKHIEEESRCKWRVMLCIPIRCLSQETSFVFGLEKFSTKAPTFPVGDGSCLTEYQEAWKSISDRQFAQVLEKEKVYNWTRCTRRVMAVVVPGDGNSLCHAVSIQMCGMIDHVMFFRRCLKETCEKQMDANSPLCKRWTAYTKLQCQQLGKTWSEEGLELAWRKIYEDCSLLPIENRSFLRQSHTTYSPLSQAHIFVLAQVSRRPIIVVGLQQKDFKPSVYLPVLIPREECVRSSIYLAYHNGHFAPLVFMDDIASANKCLDSCIPIADKDLKLFDFPYLRENEDGMTLLKQFVFTTEIAYTTTHEILEVPAVRVPEENSPSIVKSVIDPDWFIKICSQRLEGGGEPSDVFNLWKYMFELQSIFEQQLPVGFTFDDAVQPISTSLQPENDDDEGIDSDRTMRNIPTISIQNIDAADAAPSHLVTDQNNVQNTRVKLSGIEDDVAHNSLLTTAASSRNCDSHTRALSYNSTESGYQSPGDSNSPPTSLLLGFLTNPEQDNAPLSNELPNNVPLSSPVTSLEYGPNPSSHEPENDDIECDVARNEDGDHFQYLVPVDTPPQISSLSLLQSDSDHRTDSASESREYSRSLLNGVTAHCTSLDNVVIKNCKKIVFTIVKLTSQDGNKQVTLKLEKSGFNTRDKVNLTFADDPQFDIHYTHKLDDVLKVSLKKIQENLYRLHIFLPNTVVPKMTVSEESLAEATISENDHSGRDHVNLDDHPFKCRTAGCNGRAIRRYRNLCAACHEAWGEMLSLAAENSASFSYLDSVTSVDSSSNDGRCAISNCTNQGEDRYYGFCETCFHTPAI